MGVFSVIRSVFIAAVLSVSSGVYAQSSILWEVSGNGLSHPSYILGVLKFIGDKEYVLPRIAEKQLQECTLFAIEDQVDHHAQHELNKVVHLPKGESLATVLSPEDYAKLQTIFEEQFKIGAGKFKRKYARLTPLALSITMTRLSLHEGVKFYDIELLKIAKKNKLKTYSLEPIEREAQALNSFPRQRQVKVLQNLIMGNLEKQRKEFIMMENAYVKGELEKALDYSLHLFENDTVFMEEFYFKRTEEWLPKLEKMFAAEKSFVAIGILHLKGDRGLLALLRSKGYQLTPIPIN